MNKIKDLSKRRLMLILSIAFIGLILAYKITNNDKPDIVILQENWYLFLFPVLASIFFINPERHATKNAKNRNL